MDKAQFADVDNQGWWLLRLELEPALDEKRKTLGESWPWLDVRWYTDRQKLDEVFHFLETSRPDLLRDLDEAQDLYRREAWLDTLIQAKRPQEQRTGAQEAAPAAQKAADVNAARPSVAKKASAFGRRMADGEAPPGSSGAGPAAGAGAAAGAGPAAGAGAARRTPPRADEPRKPSPFSKKAAPREQPVAPASSPEPAGAPASPTAPAAADEQLQQISGEIENLMSALSADEIAAMAGDLGLTAEEVEAMVREPDFASMVAEEQAQLGAEGG